METQPTCEAVASVPEVPELSTLNTQEKIDALEAELLKFPQVEIPLVHGFAPGVYTREVTMPAGSFIIGQRHKTEHFNVVLTGRAKVLVGDGEVATVQAPCVLKSNAGIRKVLLIEEEMRWMTVHATEETDLEKLEELLVAKTPAYLAWEQQQMLERERTAELNQPKEDH